MNLVIPASVAGSLNRREEATSRIVAAWQLGPDCLLLLGHLGYTLSANDRVQCQGRVAQKPYLGFHLQESRTLYTALALRFDGKLHMPDSLTIEGENTTRHLSFQIGPVEQRAEEIDNFSPVNRKRLLNLLFLLEKQYPAIAGQAAFIAAGVELRQALPAEGNIVASYQCMDGAWLIECVLPEMNAVPFSCRMVSFSESEWKWQEMTFYPLAGENGFFLALSKSEAGQNCMLVRDQQFIPIHKGVSLPVPGLIRRLYGMEEMSRENITALIAQYVLRLPGQRKNDVRDLLHLLQHYLPHRAGGIADITLPFGLQLEHVVPLPDGNWLVIGWMRDALQQCESLSLQTELGISLKLNDLRRYRRTDVEAHYRESSYPVGNQLNGLVGWAQLTNEDKLRLQSITMPQNFRLVARLKGGLIFHARATRAQHTPKEWRNIMLTAATQTEFYPDAEKLLSEAIRQHRSVEVDTTIVEKEHVLLSQPAKPAVALITAVSEVNDYVKTFAARLAQDELMRQSEWIIMLTKPDLVQKTYYELQALAELYNLPIRMLIPSTETDDLLAVTFAVKKAHAPILLLVEAGVLPASSGAVAALLHAYPKDRESSIVTPLMMNAQEEKISAGRQLRTHYAPWQENPVYEIVPADSGPAKALAGGCIMLHKSTYDAAGGLDARYMQMDTAMADFCLRTGSNCHIAKQQQWLDLRNPTYSESSRRFDLQRLHEQRAKELRRGGH